LLLLKNEDLESVMDAHGVGLIRFDLAWSADSWFVRRIRFHLSLMSTIVSAKTEIVCGSSHMDIYASCSTGASLFEWGGLVRLFTLATMYQFGACCSLVLTITSLSLLSSR
jgi:hypothetical protein